MISNEDAARKFCLEIAGEKAFGRLEALVSLLKKENDQQNLVAEASLATVWQRHMADSLQLLAHVPRGTGAWLDLGTGAGFPGLAIAAADEERPITLVEARRLRAEWLQTASSHLGLENVTVVHSRVENVRAGLFEIVSARAFAPLAKLLPVAARFSTQETVWLLPKGRSAGQELQEQTPAVQRMFHVEPSLTDSTAGILVGRGVPQFP